MSDVLIFADEAGNFDFSRNQGASKYFAICTVTAPDWSYGNDLLDLRRDLAWRGRHLEAGFHASEDPQAIRDEVFALLSGMDVRVDATLLEKSKAEPHLHNELPLYKMAWYLHFRHVTPRVVRRDDDLLVVAAQYGTRKRRARFVEALRDVMRQVTRCNSHRVAFWPDQSEPCLWAADYFMWAIQRYYERGDDRSYRLIEPKVHSCFAPFEVGATHYY